MTVDIAVIGAGIVGLAVARELRARRPNADLVVLDREGEVAAHQTGHNSGVIHGGIYYTPGSLKARLCVEGSRLMYEYCDQHDIPYERCGKLIVALREDEVPRLDDLQARGIANEVPGLRRLTAPQIRDIEPEAVGVAALHAPNTGIVDYAAVARAIRAELSASGVQFRLGTRVTSIDQSTGTAVVATDGDAVVTRQVVVCAGLWADRLARSAGEDADPRIVPFRGAYLRLSPRETPVVNGMIYPVPNPELPFLGVHITKHIDGAVMLGPTAMMVPSRDGYSLGTLRRQDMVESILWPGTWKIAKKFWRVGLREMRMAASKRAFLAESAKYLPTISRNDLDGSVHAGVRAQAVARDGTLVDDFVLSGVGRVTHVRNAPSPAATSAFALAGEIVDRIERQTA